MAQDNQKTEDRPLQSARVILCEGADEYDILVWLRQQRRLTETNVEIQDAKGRTKLPIALGDLPYQSGGSGVRLVCVVLDAEERSGDDKKLLEELQAASAGNFALHLVELPDVQGKGGFDTLARSVVDPQSKPHQCAQAWEQCISEANDTRTQAQKDKAWAHVWLAGHGEIYSRVGYAFIKNASVRAKLGLLQKRFEDILQTVLDHPLP